MHTILPFVTSHPLWGARFCPQCLVICPGHPHRPRGPLELLLGHARASQILPPPGQGTPPPAPHTAPPSPCPAPPHPLASRPDTISPAAPVCGDAPDTPGYRPPGRPARSARSTSGSGSPSAPAPHSLLPGAWEPSGRSHDGSRHVTGARRSSPAPIPPSCPNRGAELWTPAGAQREAVMVAAPALALSAALP